MCAGLLAPVVAPWDPHLLLPAPTAWSSEAQGPSLCQSQCWRRHQRAPHPVPSSQVGDRAQRETQGVPGNRPRDSPRSLALFHVTSFLKSCQRLTDEPGKTCQNRVCTGVGRSGVRFTGLGSFQYGAEAEKLQQQLASEKEIQMQLQDEVRPPWGPGPTWGTWDPWAAA